MKLSTFITIAVCGLTLFGILMISSASSVSGSRDFHDKWYYTKRQAGWAAIGFLAFLTTSKINYKQYEKYSSALLIITFALLTIVLIPGLGIKLLGARRWLGIGSLTFQPAEIAKLTLCVYFASIFKNAPRISALVSVIGLVGVLMLLEPDLGTFLVIFGMATAMYIGSNGSWGKLLAFFPISLICLGALVAFSPYRVNRLKTFFDPTSDPQGSSYQIRQSILGLGSGGTFGLGLGQSRQKYDFLPEETTDSIFAVIGEELGLIGTVSVISGFTGLVLAGVQTAAKTKDRFGANLGIGLSSLFGIQAFLNISSLIAILPFTGVPLAFISYGGSALVVMFASAGILVNLAKNT